MLCHQYLAHRLVNEPLRKSEYKQEYKQVTDMAKWTVYTSRENNLNIYKAQYHTWNPKRKIRPRGKESTKVRKSQIKGKESENSYQKSKRSL
jgi:hypothetical protein